jgi:hypothetical protein
MVYHPTQIKELKDRAILVLIHGTVRDCSLLQTVNTGFTPTPHIHRVQGALSSRSS